MSLSLSVLTLGIAPILLKTPAFQQASCDYAPTQVGEEKGRELEYDQMCQKPRTLRKADGAVCGCPDEVTNTTASPSPLCSTYSKLGHTPPLQHPSPMSPQKMQVKRNTSRNTDPPMPKAS